MAGFAIRTSFAGHASLGAKAAHELRFALDHPVGADQRTVRIKDYRQGGAARHRTLTLEAGEFIRRVLLHVLPRGFHFATVFWLIPQRCARALRLS